MDMLDRLAPDLVPARQKRRRNLKCQRSPHLRPPRPRPHPHRRLRGLRSSPTAAGKEKDGQNLIILAVVLALLAAGGFALYRFLFSTGGEEGRSSPSPPSSAPSRARCPAAAPPRPRRPPPSPLNAGGTVQEVLIAPGQTVTAGQPLYTIFSQAAEDAGEDRPGEGGEPLQGPV